MARRGVFALGILLAAAAIAPVRAAGPLTPEDVARLRAVAAVEIAPSGEAIAYVLRVPRTPLEEEDGPAWQELHVVDASGESRPYVTGKVDVRAVAWTPDGEAISFLAKRDGDEHRSLYAIPLRGGEARRILAHETDITAYSWAPDGRRVAFLATEPEEEEEKKLEEKGFDAIVYEENLRFVRVWIADVEGGAAPRKLELEGSASELHWSPAGDRLVVALAPTPLVDDGYMRRRLHVVDAASGAIVARIDNPGKLGPVAWSPDGRRLAFLSAADPHDPAAGRVIVVDAEGGAPRDLLGETDTAHATAVAWRDAETVLFLADEGVETFFARAAADGGAVTRLVPTGGPILSGLSVSRDGTKAACLGSTPEHPSEVFFLGGGTEGPRRLTDSNPWLAETRLARQEVVRFRARDGLELEGLLVHPLETSPGTKPPLILTVHGGPESHYANGWLTSYASPGQVAAARGFAVFYPNYRGSTGRGVAFSKLGQADAAGKEFDDLVDAVDALVERGLVDAERVGITGGSYGGYASAWAATRFSDRFAAAVMFVGISDNVSKVGTTDIPYEMYMVHHRKWLWEDWSYFLDRSPIKYVTEAKTPILILAGKDDPRVHPSQSLELYRHLKTLGKAPVRLVYYPGEGHGNRRAASRFDYHLRMLRWLEHYLKGPGGAPPPPRLDYGGGKSPAPTDDRS